MTRTASARSPLGDAAAEATPGPQLVGVEDRRDGGAERDRTTELSTAGSIRLEKSDSDQ